MLGAGPPLAHPALVWDVAIGQSTVATGRVIANLFYRGLLLRRPGAARRHAAHDDRGRRAAREPLGGRGRPGSRVLRIRTVDQEDRPVLDFTRCAMLPLRDEPTGEAGDEVGGAADLDARARCAAAADGLDLAAYRARVPGPHFDVVPDGWTDEIEGGDVVDSAPALARLTLNVAMAHLDAARAAARAAARLRRAHDRARRRPGRAGAARRS